MAIFSIFTGNTGIGTSAVDPNYFEIKAVSAASVPGMTDE